MMLRNIANCQESKQKGLEEDTKPPYTPPPQRILSGEKWDEKGSTNICANSFDWPPEIPDAPSVNSADVEAAAVAVAVKRTSESVMLDNEACTDKNAKEECENAKGPAGRVSANVATELTAALRNTRERESLAHGTHTRSLVASGVVVSRSIHVDPQGDTVGVNQRYKLTSKKNPNITSSPCGSVDARRHVVAAVTHVGSPLHQPVRGILFPSSACEEGTTASLLSLVYSYCDVVTLVQLMRMNRTAHERATSDAVWKPILVGMNMLPLLSAYERDSDYYDFFLKDVVTTRALHGHYTFQAASDSHGTMSTTSGTRPASMNLDSSPWELSLQEDIFNIASLQLLISTASLGQSNHPIGRAQLLLTYKNESMEVLQGSCRFSVHRRCFSLCCNAFGTVKRGPVFTVAVATVTKPWANESFEHFSGHKNGLRLVMTPVLWEGPSPGSQITEKDILVVSRPKPVPSSTT
ncbi:hypothetical protein JKF63_00246 [Porcisia hertigi]|uniref:Uncharacterized protein n=1 Tax=Porcisia hertigi TaxID=2761500 RepID=A0A836HPM8_9TRYP|nr:hypothetical protein JKF63_00246 [Porcisia hertigi]